MLATLSLFAVVGCSDKSSIFDNVAVAVNGDEITAHQINFEMAHERMSRNSHSHKSRTDVVEALIDGQLLLQQALDAELDREPEVLRAMERAKKMVLVQAYHDRLGSTARQPTAKEVSLFYTAHPELFSQRRVYNYYEIHVGSEVDTNSIVELAQTAQSINQVADQLAARNIPNQYRVAIEGAEQVPMALLPKLVKSKPGDIVVAELPGGTVIIELIAFNDVPVSVEKAKPYIERYLTNQGRDQLVKREIGRLRSVAEIQHYKGVNDVAAMAESSSDSLYTKYTNEEQLQAAAKPTI